MRVSSARARALLSMATGTARVVVASAPALLQRLTAPVCWSRGRSACAPAPKSIRWRLSSLLADAGYDRQDPVDDHGEYCVRGGILDVYPPDELWPIRIEFIGDLVESIRRFDPGTQRSVETLDQFLVVPVRENTDAATTIITGGRHRLRLPHRAQRRTDRGVGTRRDPRRRRGRARRLPRRATTKRSAGPTRRRHCRRRRNCC